MKKTFFSILCFLFVTISIIAQDQVVNGKLTTTEYVVVGQQVSPNNFGEVMRLAITPYKHTGGPWTINSRDASGVAYLNLNYGSVKDIISIKHEGNIGIGNSNPTYKLDVSGDIRIRNLILPSGNMITPYPGDGFTYNTKNMGHYALQWVDDPWSSSGNSLWMSGYGGIKLFTTGQLRFSINGLGNVGVGTSTPTQRLDVSGNIKADGAYINGIVYTNEVKVEATKWSDFVFDKDYKLPTLQEVENHINEHKHLPDIPSEAEVKENGVSLGEMQAKLLQKIEELTLYVIELKKENQEQSKLIHDLQGKL